MKMFNVYSFVLKILVY